MVCSAANRKDKGQEGSNIRPRGRIVDQRERMLTKRFSHDVLWNCKLGEKTEAEIKVEGTQSPER